MLSRRSLLALCMATCASPAFPAEPVTIFAAASLKGALDATQPLLIADMVQARFVYASSAALARQIEQGAPADLFWSADREWIEWCAARNLLRNDTMIDLLGNRLVVIAPSDAPFTTLALESAPILTALGNGRLALGETRAVPAGRYAKEALSTLGLWGPLQPRLAETDNVRAALMLTARGETPLGIVYASDAQAEPRVKIVAEFPTHSHKPIIYPLAMTRTARMPQAQAAWQFFQSPAARTLFLREGFSVLTPPRPA